jgi:transcription initiation factor TFIIB
MENVIPQTSIPAIYKPIISVNDGEDDMWNMLDSMRCIGTVCSTCGIIAEDGQCLCVLNISEAVKQSGQCDNCSSTHLIIDEGAHVCLDCKTVQSRVIDAGAEWRYYGADDSRSGDPARCGLATNDLLPKSSLGSVIGGCRGDNRDMRRIRMFQMWNSMPYWERTLYSVFDKLLNSTSNHGVPAKVIDDAKVLYKRASEKKISRGDNKEGLIASCVYYSCLLNKIPRSPKEIARMFNIDSNVLTKGNTRFQSLLQMNVNSSNPDDYVARFASKLNMKYQDIQSCKKLAFKIDELEIVSENSPTSVAAGILYYYCMSNKIDINKKQIATTCEVSEVTITKCYKKLLKYTDHINGTIASSDNASSDSD